MRSGRCILFQRLEAEFSCDVGILCVKCFSSSNTIKNGVSEKRLARQTYQIHWQHTINEFSEALYFLLKKSRVSTPSNDVQERQHFVQQKVKEMMFSTKQAQMVSLDSFLFDLIRAEIDYSISNGEVAPTDLRIVLKALDTRLKQGGSQDFLASNPLSEFSSNSPCRCSELRVLTLQMLLFVNINAVPITDNIVKKHRVAQLLVLRDITHQPFIAQLLAEAAQPLPEPAASDWGTDDGGWTEQQPEPTSTSVAQNAGGIFDVVNRRSL